MRYGIALAALVLAGCATAAKFQAKMDGFVGKPEAAVVGAYGPPHAAYSLQDGSRVIQYTRGGQMVMPGAVTTRPITTNTTGSLTVNQGLRQSTGNYTQQSTTYVQQQAAPIVVSYSCTVTFTISPDGLVRAWSARGNDCVAD